ncbi:MED14-domain-containing protein [Daedalea quercina L-15889]|uniref:Mediator of RNA polymerase II transcription subunit 14 n=1 Tax=Daedalea quercina L-15889 TaxID=1314783 RepID=A0A165NPC3_9APHY|nr:MED14-domain-containing protein [Daedalea quercina L-15889]
METQINGHTSSNGSTLTNGFYEPPVEELERELPVVYDGQVPLGELVSRVVQAIYAELSELAETLPNMSDAARKRTLADWVVKTKKQVVKLYAIVKWSRDAGVVQKAMNITAFLMDQNRQFEEAIHGLKYAKESLDPARLRNHDLLTSLDVLTTGSYRRLPSAIQKLIVPPIPMTDEEVTKTLTDVEDVIRFRLKMSEVIPIEMSRYRIADGRVYFTVPRLFEVSLCVRGAEKEAGWFFVNVEFLLNVGGDPTCVQEFPRKPLGWLKQHITDEADARLAFYLPLPADQAQPPEAGAPPRPQLPEGVVDAPLVRIFNFLQMMSMSYMLEILCYQAGRLRVLGWGEYLKVQMSKDRKTLTLTYWVRQIPKDPALKRINLPLLGGKLTISIARAQTTPTNKANRPPKARVLAELQEKAKLRGGRPSDEVEPHELQVKWEPERSALGIIVPPEECHLAKSELSIDSDNLDVEALLCKVASIHVGAILRVVQHRLQHDQSTRSMFGPPGEVTLAAEDGVQTLRAHLCADEVVVMTIDTRTGRLNLRDTGDLAAANRGRRFTVITDRLNDNPTILYEAFSRLKLGTILDLAEQKANYLGLQSYRIRNFSPQEIQKLGPIARGMLYIELAKFPDHFLVLVVTDDDWRFALISVEALPNTPCHDLLMKDIGWLDVKRIHGEEIVISHRLHGSDPAVGQKRKRDSIDGIPEPPAMGYLTPRYTLETQVLREVYAYCCARVAFYKIEQQFKTRNIPYTTVACTNVAQTPELAHLQSTLSRSVPLLCVQSSDILSGAPAAEAAMPNIRVIPLNWWNDEKQAQVVTCVKLKYVQQPVGKRAGSNVIRPSKRIIYDTTEAIVSFLSEDVDKCVDEFLEEWARVSKIVVIAREVAQMATAKHWADVRLLSFDLQTVEFAYAGDYTVSITCTDQLSPTGGSYDLLFSRTGDRGGNMDMDMDDRCNPHEDLEPFLRNVLRHGRLVPSLQRLVRLLRDSLSVVVELEDIRQMVTRAPENVDVFPKAAGWFRILYGDFRHALDFRIMTGARVVILDASHFLFPGEESSSRARQPASQGHARKPSSTSSVMPGGSLDSHLLLQAIPDFRRIVTEVVKDAVSRGCIAHITSINIGIICDSAAVRFVARTMHERVLQRLKQG